MIYIEENSLGGDHGLLELGLGELIFVEMKCYFIFRIFFFFLLSIAARNFPLGFNLLLYSFCQN